MDIIDLISKKVLPKVTGGWEKFLTLFDRLFKDFDYHMLKVKHVLDESKRDLKYFLDERDRVHKDLRMKERQIERLRQELSLLKKGQNEAYEKLNAELSRKLDELLQVQFKFWDVDTKVKEYQRNIQQLEDEKRILETDKKKIRFEYDQINKAYHEKERELHELAAETENLREKEKHLLSLLNENPSIQESERIKSELDHLHNSLVEKETEKEILEAKYINLQGQKKQLERELLNMTLVLSKKDASIAQLHQEVEQADLEKEVFRQSLTITETQLHDTRNQIQYYQSQLAVIDQKESALQQQLMITEQEKEELEQKNDKDFHEFLAAMDKYQHDIDELKEQLEKQQQENALMAYEHENSKGLSDEERRILEREYEPRFREIYPNMRFSQPFFKDFFHLTVSDRIKAELKIAQLHYQFDTVDSKIRKHTVKTKTGSIAEFPFSQEGRIYFRRQDHLIHVYRLNRTKSEQPFVIKWLQNSL